jgi:hypothetical protein
MAMRECCDVYETPNAVKKYVHRGAVEQRKREVDMWIRDFRDAGEEPPDWLLM